ncbi:hypothetical protein ACE1TH_19235 [Shouchella sp. JSM 1781072]|uniref:hypothetical protein n=1 Tax=Shouchella sp. JSM 1781072 TaxID=3344581 RepID=UPI0035C13518
MKKTYAPLIGLLFVLFACTPVVSEEDEAYMEFLHAYRANDRGHHDLYLFYDDTTAEGEAFYQEVMDEYERSFLPLREENELVEGRTEMINICSHHQPEFELADVGIVSEALPLFILFDETGVLLRTDDVDVLMHYYESTFW